MVKENLFMYSSSLDIFYVLLQYNVDIMSLNHYLMYVAETINYLYVLTEYIYIYIYIKFIFKDLTIWNIYIFKSIYFK
jgi:hypothetical protein